MTVPKSVDPAGFLREQIESASPDLLREMVKTFADALMSAEADAVCGAAYGQRSQERVNSRNGYRPREWDTRAGTVELAIPKLAMWCVKSVMLSWASAGWPVPAAGCGR
jgi:putative transposase